jgi:hypothetical protein
VIERLGLDFKRIGPEVADYLLKDPSKILTMQFWKHFRGIDRKQADPIAHVLDVAKKSVILVR